MLLIGEKDVRIIICVICVQIYNVCAILIYIIYIVYIYIYILSRAIEDKDVLELLLA